MNKVEHIGIAVEDITQANGLYEQLLGVGPYKSEQVVSEQVLTSFFRVGDTKIELLASTDPDGPIARFIQKKGGGIHHVAFAVTDIVAEMARLRQQGFVLLNDEPKKGADDKWVCFVHPKSANGVLVELCQDVEPPMGRGGKG